MDHIFSIEYQSHVRGLLGPHNKGIGSLLNCILIGSKYSSEHDMDVSSLDLSTIFHLGTQHGFLITEYERLNEKEKIFERKSSFCIKS